MKDCETCLRYIADMKGHEGQDWYESFVKDYQNHLNEHKIKNKLPWGNWITGKAVIRTDV